MNTKQAFLHSTHIYHRKKLVECFECNETLRDLRRPCVTCGETEGYVDEIGMELCLSGHEQKPQGREENDIREDFYGERPW